MNFFCHEFGFEPFFHTNWIHILQWTSQVIDTGNSSTSSFWVGFVCLFVLCRKKKNTCQTFQKFQTLWWWSCCYLKTESKWQPYRQRQHWWQGYLRQRRRVARHTIKLQSRQGWPMPMLHSCFAGRHNWNQAQLRHSRQQCPPSQMTWSKPCKRSPWEHMTPSSSKTLPSTGLSLSLPYSSSCTIISCLCIISKYPAMSSKIVFLMFSHKTFIFRFLLCGSVLVPWGWKKHNRLHEATSHYGESIKDIINEELGDGM